MNQKKSRRAYNKGRSLSELAPWMLEIEDGIVINKDGSLMACFVIAGVDVEGRTQIDVDSFAMQAELAFREMSSRSVIWSQVHRRKISAYLDGHEFSDPVSRWIDSEWKQALESQEQYANDHTISIVIRPEHKSSRFFDRMKQFQEEGDSFPVALAKASKTLISAKNAFVYDAIQLEIALNQFKDSVQAFLTNTSDFGPKQLMGGSLRKFLHKCISPANEDQDVRKSRISTYYDTYLTDSQVGIFEDYMQFKHDKKKLVGAVSVKDWPEGSMPGLLDNLLTIPAEVTVSQIFMYTEEESSAFYISQAESHYLSTAKSFPTLIKEQFTKQESDRVNVGKLELADDASNAKREITVEKKIFGYYNLTVLFYGDTAEELIFNRDLVCRSLKINEFIAIVEREHLQSSFASTLPGQYGEVKRWHFVNTANLADLAFFRTLNTGPKVNAHFTEEMRETYESLTTLPTELSTPYYFNFHVNDVGHAFVIGPTGNGKSTVSNFFVSQFRKYPKNNVFVFDKDYSTLVPTLLQGGKFVDLLGERIPKIRLNPMHLIGDEKNWRWVKEWIEILLSHRGLEITPEIDKNIWEGIIQTRDTERESWTLSTLSSFLLTNVANHLAIWCEGGQLGQYFDNVEDDFQLSNFVSIEIGGLFSNPTLAIAFLEYAFYTINLKLDGTPTLIEIEEIWFMLSFPQFAEKIKDWLKTFRKKNAFVIFATQSLDDLATSEVFASIIDSVMTRIYLPNPDALTHYDLYRHKFNLTDSQIERIRTGVKKRNYYIVQPERSRMIDCQFPRSIINALKSTPDAIDSLLKHQATGAEDWRVQYLEEMLK